MRSLISRNSLLGVILLILPLVPQGSAAAPGKEEVLSAMKKATDFMMNTVSTHGGFVDFYTEDLSERWGEIPARNTMIWVQDPGTVSVGRTLLEAYKATSDVEFLQAAEKAGDALVWGQHPSGGWHYFIDFDMSGVEQWYEEVASKAWGWEEFYHYYGNCTFDDDTTTGATDFLLDLYMTRLDPKYRVPLLKAITFILESQYPAGGWPQRYPLRYDHPTDEGPDYTSFYTFNDGVTVNNIWLLLKAYRQLGNEEYRKAAMRGMDFVIISQLGTPQAGWAQQYDMDLQPGKARNFEPKSVAPSTTVANIQYLMRFYKITGNRKYLRGIPDALDWLDNSHLPPGHSDQGHTHAQFVELGTNKPLYAHREGISIDQGRYWVDYEPGNFPGHYGMQLRIDLDALRKEYERVFALTPEEAMAEYQAQQNAATPTPDIAPETIQKLIDSLDKRGAWVEDLSAKDYTDWKNKPRRHFRGISTRTYTTNMVTFMNYLKKL
ncbi:MAG: pectate lyase [bacterium]